MIVSLYMGKGERTECKNYRCISMFRVIGKINAWILVDRVRRVTGGLTAGEQGGFRDELRSLWREAEVFPFLSKMGC